MPPGEPQGPFFLSLLIPAPPLQTAWAHSHRASGGPLSFYVAPCSPQSNPQTCQREIL